MIKIERISAPPWQIDDASTDVRAPAAVNAGPPPEFTFVRSLISRIAYSAILASSAAAFAQAPSRPGPPRHAGGPQVSPNGKQMLFYVDTGGRPLPSIMNSDGTNQRSLNLPVANAAWLSDTKLLTLQATSRTSPRHVVVVNTDGSEPHEVAVDGLVASAIPLGDGSSILLAVFQAGADPRASAPSMRVVRLDGSVVRTITTPTVPGRRSGLRPSPDGRRIAFVAAIRDSADISPFATKSSTLYLMNIDGTDIKSVASFSNLVELPSWSRDGKKIALQHDHPHPHDATGAPLDPRDVDGDIIVVDVASGATHELKHADRHYLDETPNWSPDGHIYVQSTRDGVMEIYRMNADGSNPQRLTK